MKCGQFPSWRAQHGFTGDQATKVLGLGHNAVTKIENSDPDKPVKKVVALACAAINMGADPLGKEDYDE